MLVDVFVGRGMGVRACWCVKCAECAAECAACAAWATYAACARVVTPLSHACASFADDVDTLMLILLLTDVAADADVSLKRDIIPQLSNLSSNNPSQLTPSCLDESCCRLIALSCPV